MSEQTLLPNLAGDRERLLERQRNLAEEALTRVETERLAAVEERDEARKVARRLLALYDAGRRFRDEHERWVSDYPWLKEAGGETASPGEEVSR